MRYRIFILFFFTAAISLYGQDNSLNEKGKVSYITTQNVYVKFESTENIQIGDTLFADKNGQIIPALVVENKSSVSCVCKPVANSKLVVSDEIYTIELEKENPPEKTPINQPVLKMSSDEQQPRFFTGKIGEKPENTAKESIAEDKLPEEIMPTPKFKQNITGRISAATYINFAGSISNPRSRYTFSMVGDNLGNSRLSAEAYISFRHNYNDWEKVQNNINSALKIYALAFRYDFNESTAIIAGRKINPMISSMGAIDGIQFEKGFGNFLFGALVGSRPDNLDYSYNSKLFQYGAYLSHRSSSENTYLQSSIAYIEQRNDAKIDRRFIYFQNNSSLFRNLNLFISAEISLYENINEQVKNVFTPTNLYASLSYRATKKLNLSLSYDNRKNVQYYETYKNFIDKLIEEETRQGVRFNVNYRLLKNVTWGINTGWRFQKSDKNLSKNVNTYLTFGCISALNIRTTVNANFLQTNYLNSKIFGINISKTILKGRVDGDINFRVVDYQYLNYETVTHQNIAGINLSVNIIRNLSLYLNYEGVFDSQNIVYNQFYAKIIKRF